MAARRMNIHDASAIFGPENADGRNSFSLANYFNWLLSLFPRLTSGSIHSFVCSVQGMLCKAQWPSWNRPMKRGGINRFRIYRSSPMKSS
jgi:hypothetical protein